LSLGETKRSEFPIYKNKTIESISWGVCPRTQRGHRRRASVVPLCGCVTSIQCTATIGCV